MSRCVLYERIVSLDTIRDPDDKAQELLRIFGRKPLSATSAWHIPRSVALGGGTRRHPIARPADFMLRPGAASGRNLMRGTKLIHERLEPADGTGSTIRFAPE